MNIGCTPCQKTGSRPAGSKTIVDKWRFRPPRSTARVTAFKSGTGVNIVVAQMARNNCHRDRECASGLGQVGDEWPGALLAGARGEHEDADVGVLVDQLDDFFRRIAFADHPVGCDASDLFCPGGELVEGGICRLLLLGHHDVGYTEPLLISIARLDHAQHHNLRFGAARPFRRPVDRAVAFFGVDDYPQIFALVAGLVAATLDAHGVDGGTPAGAPTRREFRAATTGARNRRYP